MAQLCDMFVGMENVQEQECLEIGRGDQPEP